MEIAQTIFEQIGGNKFIAMTGAKNFSGSDKSLSFYLPLRSKKYCKIALNGGDLYDMQFLDKNLTVVAESKDIFAEQLQSEFTRHTKLYTSL